MFVKIERLAECGILTEKDVEELKEAGYKEVWTYEEALQDFAALNSAVWAVKTPEPTEEEVQEWNQIYDEMVELNYPFKSFGSWAKSAGLPVGAGYVRTPDPTDEEIQDWQKFNEELINMDWEEARKCVKFVDVSPRSKPYDSDGYNLYFYQNETLRATSVEENIAKYKMPGPDSVHKENENIIPSSIVGTIYHGTTPIQTFIIHDCSKGTLTNIWTHDFHAKTIFLGGYLEETWLTVVWNKDVPPDTRITASYEASAYEW